MPRKVKVVNINDDSTYGDVAEAIVENEKQKTKHLKKPKHQWWNHPNPRHERNECPNPKLLLLMWQLMLIRQLRLKHQHQY